MAETKIYIPDETDRRLRESAMRRFGYGRGSISRAVEEAVTQWLVRTGRVERAIETIVSHAKTDKDVLGVLVFGSYVKKDPSWRDVDIGIVLKETSRSGKKIVEYGALVDNDDRLFDISILNDLPLDIRVNAINNGEFVYVKDAGEEYEYAAAVMREWSDFQPRFRMMVD